MLGNKKKKDKHTQDVRLVDKVHEIDFFILRTRRRQKKQTNDYNVKVTWCNSLFFFSEDARFSIFWFLPEDALFIYFFSLKMFCSFFPHRDGKKRKKNTFNQWNFDVGVRKTRKQQLSFLTVRTRPLTISHHPEYSYQMYIDLLLLKINLVRFRKSFKKYKYLFFCFWPLMVNSYMHILYSLDRKDDLDRLGFKKMKRTTLKKE